MGAQIFIIVFLYLMLLPFLRMSVKAFIIAWTIPCIIMSILMLFAGGHPPGIYVIPYILFVWVMGLIPIPFIKPYILRTKKMALRKLKKPKNKLNAPNKRMQSDQATRYASALAADAGRYEAS